MQKKKTRHRPGSCARQDGGGVLTMPISIRARSSCIVPPARLRPGSSCVADFAGEIGSDALGERPPDVRKHQRLWPIGGAYWPHGNAEFSAGSWAFGPPLNPRRADFICPCACRRSAMTASAINVVVSLVSGEWIAYRFSLRGKTRKIKCVNEFVRYQSIPANRGALDCQQVACAEAQA